MDINAATDAALQLVTAIDDLLTIARHPTLLRRSLWEKAAIRIEPIFDNYKAVVWECQSIRELEIDGGVTIPNPSAEGLHPPTPNGIARPSAFDLASMFEEAQQSGREMSQLVSEWCKQRSGEAEKWRQFKRSKSCLPPRHFNACNYHMMIGELGRYVVGQLVESQMELGWGPHKVVLNGEVITSPMTVDDGLLAEWIENHGFHDPTIADGMPVGMQISANCVLTTLVGFDEVLFKRKIQNESRTMIARLDCHEHFTPSYLTDGQPEAEGSGLMPNEIDFEGEVYKIGESRGAKIIRHLLKKKDWTDTVEKVTEQLGGLRADAESLYRYVTQVRRKCQIPLTLHRSAKRVWLKRVGS